MCRRSTAYSQSEALESTRRAQRIRTHIRTGRCLLPAWRAVLQVRRDKHRDKQTEGWAKGNQAERPYHQHHRLEFLLLLRVGGQDQPPHTHTAHFCEDLCAQPVLRAILRIRVSNTECLGQVNSRVIVRRSCAGTRARTGHVVEGSPVSRRTIQQTHGNRQGGHVRQPHHERVETRIKEKIKRRKAQRLLSNEHQRRHRGRTPSSAWINATNWSQPGAWTHHAAESNAQ